MFQRKIILLLMLSLLCIPACQDDPEYKELTFTETNQPPPGYDTIVESDIIVLSPGIVQAVKADVEYKGDRYLRGSFVDLSSQNENIFGVFSMGKKNQFLLIGRGEGQTCMEVTVNGEWEECIDVTIE
jgi:hypothetical protein